MPQLKCYQFVLLCLFSLFSFSHNLHADTYIWTGAGNSNHWTEEDNWDQNKIPGEEDEVIIPSYSGVVDYKHDAPTIKSLTVHRNSEIIIWPDRLLQVIGADDHGISNSGKITNNGYLLISGCKTSGFSNNYFGFVYNNGIVELQENSGEGVHNEGYFSNNAEGRIYFYSSGFFDLFNIYGHFVNKGLLNFKGDSHQQGISAGGDFSNIDTGRIVMDNSSAARIELPSDGIFENTAEILFSNNDNAQSKIHLSHNAFFYNGNNGVINVKGFSSYGLRIDQYASFYNYGMLRIYGDGPEDNCAAISLGGNGAHFECGQSGGFEIEDVEVAIHIDNPGAKFTNENYAFIFNVGTGILNQGHFKNSPQAVMTILDAETGIINEESGNFDNDDAQIEIYIVKDDNDIINYGNLINRNCANITLYKGNVFNPGEIINQAWITNMSPNGSYTANPIINQGIFIDPGINYTQQVQNEKMYVHRLEKLVVNEENEDIFDFGNTNDLIVSDFFIPSPPWSDAGIYDQNNNTFIPNQNAIGHNSLFAIVSLRNCTKRIRVTVENSIQPYVISNPTNQTSFEELELQVLQEGHLNIHPNPSSGLITIQLDKDEKSPVSLEIFSMNGQLVWSEKNIDRANFQLNLQDKLSSGVYLIQAGSELKKYPPKRLIIQSQ